MFDLKIGNIYNGVSTVPRDDNTIQRKIQKFTQKEEKMYKDKHCVCCYNEFRCSSLETTKTCCSGNCEELVKFKNIIYRDIIHCDTHQQCSKRENGGSDNNLSDDDRPCKTQKVKI